jgi:hypothetical protein
MVNGVERNSQSTQATTRQINVTDLTTHQRRRIFINCLIQAGFVAFVKKKIGNQTYYVFIYETSL